MWLICALLGLVVAGSAALAAGGAAAGASVEAGASEGGAVGVEAVAAGVGAQPIQVGHPRRGRAGPFDAVLKQSKYQI
jgi:hypothetical protein